MLLACLLLGPVVQAASAAPAFDSIEAVRADWNSTQAPAQGWSAVQLPDGWTGRWPGHDGVVWYRLRWREAQARPGPRALRITDLNMAGAIYLNGSEIARDAHLAEPLSRSWNLPRYWLLDAPLLRPGANELLVRVSGLATYQPGLGRVQLGEPGPLQAQHERDVLVLRSLQWLALGLTLVMGVLYGMLWLLRRSEVSYGWFSLFSLLWVPYSYNYVALEAWPFARTAAFQSANHIALFASLSCFLLFALEFCRVERRWPRWAVGAVALLFIGLAFSPAPMQSAVRNLTVVAALGLYIVACAVLVRHTIRSRRIEAAVLALCLMLPFVAGLHDTLVFLQLIPGSRYYAALASSGTLLGISFVLTWRMVKGMELVENFNRELRQRVDDATRQLAEGLHHQHAAELVQTRLTERLSLVRDLHDGLGLTLSSHINALREQAEGERPIALRALEEVNDDLRLIIEGSSFDDTDELGERLVPLRHRLTRVLEAGGIECRWTLEGLAGCRLGGRRSLDFLRVLQEAMANVLKHSGANCVEVQVLAEDGQLRLLVRDNGAGFAALQAADGASPGMGLSSMRARAVRLGGTLAIRSGDAGTTLELRCPVRASESQPA